MDIRGDFQGDKGRGNKWIMGLTIPSAESYLQQSSRRNEGEEEEKEGEEVGRRSHSSSAFQLYLRIHYSQRHGQTVEGESTNDHRF